jgi:trigger factor
MEMKEAGISEDEIKARQRLLERDVVSSTASALKEHFVLQKIAEQEKLELDKHEIDEEIERIAEVYKETPRRIRAQLEREDQMETLAAQLIERKALDLILSSAEYEEVKIGKEGGLATVEAQAVPGEMKDPTAAPPEEKPAEGENASA